MQKYLENTENKFDKELVIIITTLSDTLWFYLPNFKGIQEKCENHYKKFYSSLETENCYRKFQLSEILIVTLKSNKPSKQFFALSQFFIHTFTIVHSTSCKFHFTSFFKNPFKTFYVDNSIEKNEIFFNNVNKDYKLSLLFKESKEYIEINKEGLEKFFLDFENYCKEKNIRLEFFLLYYLSNKKHIIDIILQQVKSPKKNEKANVFNLYTTKQVITNTRVKLTQLISDSSWQALTSIDNNGLVPAYLINQLKQLIYKNLREKLNYKKVIINGVEKGVIIENIAEVIKIQLDFFTLINKIPSDSISIKVHWDGRASYKNTPETPFSITILIDGYCGSAEFVVPIALICATVCFIYLILFIKFLTHLFLLNF